MSSSKIAAAVLVLDECGVFAMKRKRKRSEWSNQWLRERRKWSHINLLHHLKDNSAQYYKNYLGMTESDFNYLLELIKPGISKQNTTMRESISAEHRLVATLRFLATGRSLEDLKFSCAISAQSLGKIIPETCKEIYKCLKTEFMKFPKNKEEWAEVANGFQQLWNFPNCGGSIDGKHVAISRPANIGSYYYNYKGYYSIVLLGIVDANLEFIMVDVGCNGRVSDGGVIEETKFYEKLKNGTLNLPERAETVENMNFVFIGDDAFALRKDLLKPFAFKTLTYEQRVFNYRISRARRVVENAFGVLATRFRIVHTTINLQPTKVVDVTLACVALHNYLRKKCRQSYTPMNSLTIEDTEMGRIVEGECSKDPVSKNHFQGLHVASRNPTNIAKESRLEYMSFFNGKCSVPWQDCMVKNSARQ